jgi:HK97 family phage major capsid protein
LQAIVDEAGDESFSAVQLADYEALEVELASAQKSDEARKRQSARRSPVIDGMAAVIGAQPKGEDAEANFAFESYLRTGQVNVDMAHTFAQTSGSNSAGGYTVPDTFRNKLVEVQKAFGGLRGAAESLVTADGSPIRWMTNDDVTTSGDAKSDIAAEGAQSAVGADLTFGEVTLGAYRYAATGTGNIPLKISFELLQDSALDIGTFVAKRLGNRIARKQALDLEQGSGSGAPLGLMTGTHTGDVALAGGGAITYAKLNALVHKLDPAYRPGASWIFNDATAALIEAITDTNARPLLQPSAQGGIAGAVSSSTLLGYPVIIDQSVPAEANQVNFAAFGDLKEAYIVREVRDVQVLVNPYSQPGYIVYDAWARMDGTIQNAKAVVKLEGTT